MDTGAVVTVADDKLNAPRTLSRNAHPRMTWTTVRTRHPALATLIVHGAEVAAWIAFYVAIRALVG
jgi:hypothetical protein